jgi:hypothetical protein
MSKLVKLHEPNPLDDGEPIGDDLMMILEIYEANPGPPLKYTVLVPFSIAEKLKPGDTISFYALSISEPYELKMISIEPTHMGRLKTRFIL